MVLDGALNQASSGLDSIARRLATVAQNVANADTPGYVREHLAVSSLSAADGGLGVRSGVAMRSVDAALQADVFAAAGQVAGDEVRQAVLSQIDAASGAPGSGQDLAGLVGALRDAFSTLAGDPASQSQQREVVNQAAALARGVNALAATVSGARQAVQDALSDDVAAANAALRDVGALSQRISVAAARHESTADLEDKRDAAMRAVTELTGAKFLPQPDGSVLAFSGGTSLSVTDPTGPLSIARATLAPDTPVSAVPALLVSGSAAPVVGGRIGARLDLRDSVLPGLQAGLDGFAQALASGFAGVGLGLFSDAAGVLPTAVTPGFAQAVQVSPAVRALPSMVRDGAATPGAAGLTTLIDSVLGTTLAGGSGGLEARGAELVSAHAGLAAAASGRLAVDQAVQGALAKKLEAGTGVTIDSEMADMVRLQNSYGANAKVVTAVQAMWDRLLESVR